MGPRNAALGGGNACELRHWDLRWSSLWGYATLHWVGGNACGAAMRTALRHWAFRWSSLWGQETLHWVVGVSKLFVLRQVVFQLLRASTNAEGGRVVSASSNSRHNHVAGVHVPQNAFCQKAPKFSVTRNLAHTCMSVHAAWALCLPRSMPAARPVRRLMEWRSRKRRTTTIRIGSGGEEEVQEEEEQEGGTARIDQRGGEGNGRGEGETD